MPRAILPGLIVCALMIGSGWAIAGAAGLDASRLPAAYLSSALAITFIGLLTWTFLELLKLAKQRADAPLSVIASRIRGRSELLVFPAVVTPIFFAAFTTAKSGIWRLAGFRWDRAFADMDAWIFGTDPWRLTHAVFGPVATAVMEWCYTAGWGFGLAIANVVVAMSASRRLAGTYFLAMFVCWFVGGFVLAYLFCSAGPVFAHLADPALAERFAPLVDSLSRGLDPDSPILMSQAYLLSAIDSPLVTRGGGISAMPSMHIGAAAVVVMAARGTRWFWLALAFLVMTLVGSVHFGYHYAVDGLLVIPLAILCWKAAELAFPRPLSGAVPLPAMSTASSVSA